VAGLGHRGRILLLWVIDHLNENDRYLGIDPYPCYAGHPRYSSSSVQRGSMQLLERQGMRLDLGRYSLNRRDEKTIHINNMMIISYSAHVTDRRGCR